MSEKELYQQKKQAQLDEWQAEVDKLRAQASGAVADSRIELNKQCEALEGRIEEGKTQLAGITEDAWESIKDGVESVKDGVESAWDSTKSAFNGVVNKFRK